ncbi:hypothetical protein F2P56_004489 [Juglans regia]|uniref:Protein BOBBER 2-like n=2 Tax=Juglans regia TaxID=51240 RepID=A0A2I4DH47_JUGRE|nr:protein BOBBER 2-like [Juglans regia]KAF5477881.1 hypothetical protein F2P56_004489 [Juglans regia]
MAILSDYQEDQPHDQHYSSNSFSFNAVLDPSNPLGFLESAFNFVSQKSDLFKNDSAEKEIMSSVRSIKEKIKAQEADQKKRLKLAEASAKMATDQKEQEQKEKEKEKKQLVPNHGNGLDMENYSWGQSLQEVTINVPVPHGTKSSLVLCEIKNNSLKIGLKGQPPIIDGGLYKPVKADDCFWSLEDQKSISVLMSKRDQIDWWKSLLKSGPEIDTQKVEPEPSRLSELDSETRSAVEKMMFDQRQKQLGRPSSDEIQKQELLKQFMAQNPNMNFSGTKFR